MSIQQNFPAISPSLSLNFARSKTLDPRITFTRTSSATRVNETGLIEVVSANAPRFDHSYDPVSGTVKSLGLLVEESRSNLLTGSDYSTNNSLGNVLLTLNAGIAPDGTNTAVSMDGENSNNNSKYMYKGYSTTTTGTYTTSVFMKYKSERYVVLRMNDNGGVNGVLQRIDILNGIFTNNVEAGGTVTNASSSITPYPNGWYRISVSGTFNDPLVQVQGAQVWLTTYGSTTTTNGVYLWGAQLEQGSFPTSYIPTQGSTATRTRDNASMTGDNFSDWYNQDEGTVVIKAKTNGTTDGINNIFPYSMQIDNGSGGLSNFAIDNGILTNGAIRQFFAARNDGVTISTGMGNNISYNGLTCSFSYKTDDLAFVNGGGTLFTKGDASIPTDMVRLLIGSGNGGTIRGTVSQLTYYPRRLSNENLQNLTK